MIDVTKIKRPLIIPEIPEEGNKNSTILNMRSTGKRSRYVKKAFLNERLSILNIFPQATHSTGVKIETNAIERIKTVKIINI
jgi:hypothetical protein